MGQLWREEEHNAEDLQGRALRALAILTAIDQAELLADLPAKSDARERHLHATALLEIVREEVAALYEAIRQQPHFDQAAGHPDLGL